MKTIFHLSSCDTCKRILGEIGPTPGFTLQDIRTEAVSAAQLETMHSLSGSYEALFNKRARLYKERGLNQQQLGEEDYKKLLLEHYTFLKRPVIVGKDQIFAGNSKKTVAQAKEFLGS
ncbi:hypothetical protein PP178_05470 [Zeaxanthinibacter sp. PT1]|uniref:arsenate reductase family protein n=1 Tax=Zeaxanthinibacter TaxID=561554 RepID=UPI00234B2969|nr:ArsC/Spx/MgsR family protein [Zeaxanthinibacter sp. PT1]MDC6350993.1 hypothetical protein [Zeaxanthinibacter sp. PT1]